MDLLLPLDHAGPVDDARLLDLYAHPTHAPGRASRSGYVRANMISTLDGAATGADEVSSSINGPADLRVFETMRAAADVVLIGAGTARDERYTSLDVPARLRGAREALGLRPDLELAIVTSSGILGPIILGGPRPPLVLTHEACPRLEELRDLVGHERVLTLGKGALRTTDVVAALADRGLPRVLAEGGPHLLSGLLATNQVDELCLTWSPLVVGGTGLRVLAAPGWLMPPYDATPAHLLHEEGTLLGRWLLARQERPGT